MEPANIKILTAILVFCLLFIVGLAMFTAVSAEYVHVHYAGKKEYNYGQAALYCGSQPGENYRLPDILELVGLYYFRDDVDFYPSTDYWSQSKLMNRAFGLNTRLGILSFDSIDDEDHVICVSK